MLPAMLPVLANVSQMLHGCSPCTVVGRWSEFGCGFTVSYDGETFACVLQEMAAGNQLLFSSVMTTLMMGALNY